MKTRNIRYGTTLSALVWLAAAGTIQASEAPAGRFVMTFYEDMAQGRELFEEALDLQSRRPHSLLRANTAGNLALLDMDLTAAR